MLLDASTHQLAHRADAVLAGLTEALRDKASPETHACVLELRTRVNDTVPGAIGELYRLRSALAWELAGMGLRPAAAGTHPQASPRSGDHPRTARYQFVYGSMRELARREPTFGLHVHVGVPDAEQAIHAANRLRTELPLLLALSVNSPFWQGRDTGLASARTPLFQAFPRVGIPRAFRSTRSTSSRSTC